MESFITIFIIITALVIAFPVVFFWHWLLKKYMTKPAKRIVAIGIATFLSVPIVMWLFYWGINYLFNLHYGSP